MPRGRLQKVARAPEAPCVESGRSVSDAAWLAALLCALALVLAELVLAVPLSRLLYPSGPAIELLPDDPGRLIPEPREDTRYVIALFIPVFLALATVAIARVPRTRPNARWRPAAVSAVQWLAIAIIATCLVAQHRVRWRFSYFDVRTLLVAAVVAAAIVVATPFVRARADRLHGSIPRAWPAIAVAIAVAIAAMWVFPAVHTEDSITWSPLYYDTSFPLDETFAVLNGLTPLVDFKMQYATLLPYLTAGVMLAFGKTMLVFTITMCTLSVLALLAVYGVLRRAARSRLLALALFVPFVATGLFDPLGLSFARFTAGKYFAMFPLRYGGAYLLAWLLARRLDAQPDARDWPLFAVGGLVLLNNADYGLCALGATVAALIVTRADGGGRALLLLARSLLIGLAVAFTAVTALTLVRAGALPRFDAAARYSRLYGIAGYSATPMPSLLGLPLVIYLTYVAATGTAVVRAIKGEQNRVLTGMLMWSGIFGLGSLSYYVARSDPFVLPMMFSPWVLAMALLTLTVVGTPAVRVRRPTPAMLAVLFGIGLAACSIAQAPAPWTELAQMQTPPAQVNPGPTTWSKPLPRDPAVRRFVSSVAVAGDRFAMRPGAPIALFLTIGHRVADAYGVVNVIPFTGPESMHTFAEFEEALDALRAAGGNTALVPWQRVRTLHEPLERHGFRILTHRGVRRSPIGAAGKMPADAIVVEELTKWVDTHHPYT
jgi:hypothetical protein